MIGPLALASDAASRALGRAAPEAGNVYLETLSVARCFLAEFRSAPPGVVYAASSRRPLYPLDGVLAGREAPRCW